MPPQKTLPQIEMAIAKLREQIKDGAANREIAQTQLTELLDEREKALKAIWKDSKPTKDTEITSPASSPLAFVLE